MNLKEKYNRDEFVKFIKNFIPCYAQDIRPADSNGLGITKDAYFLGECSELDLSIFELTHMSQRDARVALSMDGFKLMKRSAAYRALVVYHAENGDDWRLSLMTVDPDVSEKGKITETFSNPRRLSFFLGPKAKVRTPNKFLINKGAVKDFDDLVSCFDVEVVEKEFFAHYKKLYEQLREYLDKDHAFANFAAKNNVDLNPFAKKLLGQIVFCYFLQRKGWLGALSEKAVSDGDIDFMRSMFVRFTSNGKNFFNDCLEYLFYDSLNKPSEASASFYRPHFNCQVPFLNGGLFEPLEYYDWEKEFLYIPNEIFSNNDKTGILDIFDLYNFTVYEDDPTDREVAVDPEMLGKVFENLLDENIRKGQGAFYTPREIVHYMCQESLINYLTAGNDLDRYKIRALIKKQEVSFGDSEKQKLNNLLSNIKVCDPACGSGAFLVGMLNEIIAARRQLIQAPEHLLKKESIENSIYGVDIDLGAVEIAKLRLWLSLVVDYELDAIEPLPNLDYKIMCGNSLLEELVICSDTIQLFDPDLIKNEHRNKSITKEEREKIEREIKQKQKEFITLKQQYKLSKEETSEREDEIKQLQKQIGPKRTHNTHLKKLDQATLFEEKTIDYFKILRELHRKYFREHDSSEKKQIRERIDSIEFSFIQHSVDKKTDEINEKIKNLNMQKPEDRKKNSELLKKKLDYSSIPSNIKQTKLRPYFLWYLNFHEVFQDKGGFDVVIANPPYGLVGSDREVEKKYYTSGRFKLVAYKINFYLLFIERGLELLKPDYGVQSFIVPKSLVFNSYYEKTRRNLLTSYSVPLIVELEGKVFNSAEVGDSILMFAQMKRPTQDSYLVYRIDDAVSPGSLIISSQKNLQSDLMKTAGCMFRKTGLNLPRTKQTLFDICSVNNGLNPGNVKHILLSNEKLSEKHRKLLLGRNLQRYAINWSGTWVNFDYSLKDKINVSEIKSKKGMTAQKRVDFALRSIEIYEPMKVMVRKTADHIIACLDRDGLCFDSLSYGIRSKDKRLSPKYILGLLNSKFINYIHDEFSQNQGKVFAKVLAKNLKKLPMPDLDINSSEGLEKHDSIVKLVDQILIQKENDPMGDSSHLESEIDEIVFNLYGITDEERKIIAEAIYPLLAREVLSKN